MEETCMKTRTFMVVVDCFVIGRVTTAYTITDDGELKAGFAYCSPCLLYTSDAADDLLCVDLGGRRIL